MTTSTEKSLQLEDSKHATELLVDKFYTLRKTFEAAYSGKLRSHKYEETKAFTIALNHAIFQANQVLSEKVMAFNNTSDLEGILENLRKDFHFLKS